MDNKTNISHSSEPAPKNLLLSSQSLRAALFIAALGVASILIAISYEGIASFSSYSTGGKILTIITSYAWGAFIIMGGFWVFDKRIGKFFPITGTVAGIISIFWSLAGIIIMPVILLLLIPLVKFAYHLSRFHYAKSIS